MRLDKDEIKTKLEGVPIDICVAFALRSAMRVLPLLAIQKKDEIKFWQEENKADFLLAIYQAYAYAFSVILVKNKTFFNATTNAAYNTLYADTDGANTDAFVVDAAADAASAADSYSDYTAYSASFKTANPSRGFDDFFYSDYSAPNAAFKASNTAVNAAFKACNAAYTYSYYSADVFIQEINQDLDTLNRKSVTEFLSQPLWSYDIPKYFEQLIADFKANVLSLDAGFEVWLDWYEQRLFDQAVDIEWFQQYCNIPEEIQEQGAAKFNAHLKTLIK